MFAKLTRPSDLAKRVIRAAFPGWRGRTVYVSSAQENDQGKCSVHVHNWWDEGNKECPAVVAPIGAGRVVARPGTNHPHFDKNPANVEFDGRDILVLHVFSGVRQYIRLVATEAVIAELGEIRQNR